MYNKNGLRVRFGEEPFQLEVVRDMHGSLQSLSSPRPSDFHSHMRNGPMMRAVAEAQMKWVNHLLVMPNTGPITTIEQMERYAADLRVLARGCGSNANIVPTIYFTEALRPEVVAQMAELSTTSAVKYYPPQAGATTGSGFGAPLRDMRETLQAMSDFGIRFLLHGESVENSQGKVLDHVIREDYFYDNEYPWLRETYPDLLISLEHISTTTAVEKVREDTSGKTVCTITPHHLLLTMHDMNPDVYAWCNHMKCMPILKREDDRQALLEFATSGDARVILGTDTAPHPSRSKVGNIEDTSVACGAYVPHAFALYAKAFDEAGKLDEAFVDFACLNGPRWWELPLPKPGDRIALGPAESGNGIPHPTPVAELYDYIFPLGWWQDPNARYELAQRLYDHNEFH